MPVNQLQIVTVSKFSTPRDKLWYFCVHSDESQLVDVDTNTRRLEGKQHSQLIVKKDLSSSKPLDQ